jgi:Putative DNA-binding domain
MSMLREFQEQTLGSLLQNDFRRRPERRCGAEAVPSYLAIHQTTIFGSLTRALRYSFPTVSKLLGEREFERIAIAYARSDPPRAACLNVYGSGFPKYLRSVRAQALTAALLVDVARFDLAVQEVANEPLGIFQEPVVLSGNTMLRLDRSLRCEEYGYRVDEVRDLSASTISRTEKTVPRPARRNLALWRKNDGAAVKVLSRSSVRFLAALLSGQGPQRAIVLAVSRSNPEEVICRLQHEVLASQFCRVTARTEPCT